MPLGGAANSASTSTSRPAAISLSTSQVLRQAMPQPGQAPVVQHLAVGAIERAARLEVDHLVALAGLGTRKAQPRVCEASLDSVRQSNRASSFGCCGVPCRLR